MKLFIHGVSWKGACVMGPVHSAMYDEWGYCGYAVIAGGSV